MLAAIRLAQAKALQLAAAFSQVYLMFCHRLCVPMLVVLIELSQLLNSFSAEAS
jgi:hypothetical protein